VLKKNPELVEEFADKAADLLHDKNQGVALSGVTLLLAICNMQPAMVEDYRQQVPALCKMLRGLLQVRRESVQQQQQERQQQQLGEQCGELELL
jgi:hypothetical protein